MSVEVFTFWRTKAAGPCVLRHMAILTLYSQAGIGPAFPFFVCILHRRSRGGMREIVANPAEFGAFQELGLGGDMIGSIGIGVSTIFDRSVSLSRIEIDAAADFVAKVFVAGDRMAKITSYALHRHRANFRRIRNGRVGRNLLVHCSHGCVAPQAKTC